MDNIGQVADIVVHSRSRQSGVSAPFLFRWVVAIVFLETAPRTNQHPKSSSHWNRGRWGRGERGEGARLPANRYESYADLQRAAARGIDSNENSHLPTYATRCHWITRYCPTFGYQSGLDP
jgi:hypothetical protein